MWLGYCLVFLLLISHAIPFSAQDLPVRIPKVLYSCDTAGVLGCFPLIRNGDKSYELGNTSKATLVGEEATVAVDQFSAEKIVIHYKDAEKTAIFTGRLLGALVQGTVTSTTRAGGKTIQLDGKWTALVVGEAADFAQVSSRMPAVMNVCQTNDDDRGLPREDCFTWSWDAKSPAFAGNFLTVERFDQGGVRIMGSSQHGTAVLAAYSGKMEGSRIQGTIEYFSGDGHNWSGTWTASLTPAGKTQGSGIDAKF